MENESRSSIDDCGQSIYILTNCMAYVLPAANAVYARAGNRYYARQDISRWRVVQSAPSQLKLIYTIEAHIVNRNFGIALVMQRNKHPIRTVMWYVCG